MKKVQVNNLVPHSLSGHKIIGYRIMSLIVMASPFKHRDLNIFVLFRVIEALLRCFPVAVAKLKPFVACPALRTCNVVYCAQDIKNVEQWDGDDDEPRHVIINTEWGAFGANGELDFIRTKWDMAGMEGKWGHGRY